MGQSRIVIESTGQHHNDSPKDADKVARDTVSTLQAMGHNVTKAEFQLRSFDGTEEKLQIDNLLPEAKVAEVEAVGTGAGDIGAGTGAAADSEAGTGNAGGDGPQA
jgi:hypothetical protein